MAENAGHSGRPPTPRASRQNPSLTGIPELGSARAGAWGKHGSHPPRPWEEEVLETGREGGWSCIYRALADLALGFLCAQGWESNPVWPRG